MPLRYNSSTVTAAALDFEVLDEDQLEDSKDSLIQQQAAGRRQDISSFSAAFLNVHLWVNFPSWLGRCFLMTPGEGVGVFC